MLGRAEILRAIRVRKLLAQADAETAAGPAYAAKARQLAASCRDGQLVIATYDKEKRRP